MTLKNKTNKTGLNQVKNEFERMVLTMKKEDLIKLGLDEATATKVEAASTEELKGFIPKVRFDEVNVAKKQLELDVKERDTQLQTLKDSTGDAEVLKKTITDLQTANAAKDAELAATVKKLQVDNAVDKALLGAKAKNTKAVKALLSEFLDKAELDGENIKGLDDEIKKLTEAEDSKFMFDVTTTKQPMFKGIKPGEKSDKTPGEGAPTSLADAVKMHFQSNE